MIKNLIIKFYLIFQQTHKNTIKRCKRTNSFKNLKDKSLFKYISNNLAYLTKIYIYIHYLIKTNSS